MASLYVGNIPWTATDEDLATIFDQYNYEEIEVVSDRNGRSRGYALVHFNGKEDADMALSNLENAELEVGGRKIYVREDRGKPTPGQNNSGGFNNNNSGGYNNNRGGGGGGGGGGYNSRNDEVDENFTGTSVYVGNLSWNVNVDGLLDAFQDFAPADAMVKEDRVSGRSRGWGTVQFNDADTAQRVIDEMNGQEIDGRPVNLRIDRRG